jgi:hypothetical protein
MINSRLISLLLLVPYNLKMTVLYNEEELRHSKRRAGRDERYNATNDNDTSLLNKIKTHVVNKEIVEILNNGETSVQHKLNIIDFYLKDRNFSSSSNTRVAGYDLSAGNLFRDFNPLENITEVF